MLENNMDDFTPQQKKTIEALVVEIIKKYNRGAGFTERRTTDTIPIDALSVVNRTFVAGNGTFANRPRAIKAQPYFATDLATNGMPTWNNGTNWVSATGSILGAGI